MPFRLAVATVEQLVGRGETDPRVFLAPLRAACANRQRQFRSQACAFTSTPNWIFVQYFQYFKLDFKSKIILEKQRIKSVCDNGPAVPDRDDVDRQNSLSQDRWPNGVT
jgi:hypothetical protein